MLFDDWLSLSLAHLDILLVDCVILLRHIFQQKFVMVLNLCLYLIIARHPPVHLRLLRLLRFKSHCGLILLAEIRHEITECISAAARLT